MRISNALKNSHLQMGYDFVSIKFLILRVLPVPECLKFRTADALGRRSGAEAVGSRYLGYPSGANLHTLPTLWRSQISTTDSFRARSSTESIRGKKFQAFWDRQYP